MGLFSGNKKRKEEKALAQRENEWSWRKESASKLLLEKIASYQDESERDGLYQIFASEMSDTISESEEEFLSDFSKTKELYSISLRALVTISSNNCVFYQTQEKWDALASQGEDAMRRKIAYDMDRTIPGVLLFQRSASELCIIELYLNKYINKCMYLCGLNLEDDGTEEHQQMYNSSIDFASKVYEAVVVRPCWKQWQHQNPIKGSFDDEFVEILHEKDYDMFGEEAFKTDYIGKWLKVFLDSFMSYSSEHFRIFKEKQSFWEEINNEFSNLDVQSRYLFSDVFRAQKSAIYQKENWEKEEDYNNFSMYVNIVLGLAKRFNEENT